MNLPFPKMNLTFLRHFKKDRPAEGGVAIVARPATPLDKPASERFGKTVMPNVSRVVGVDAMPDFSLDGPLGNPPPATPSARKISLGGSGSIAVESKKASTDDPAAAERTIALQLIDLVPHLPAGLLKTAPVDPEHRVLIKASELERGMASGRPTVSLRSIFQQAPDFFQCDVEATDKREVVLPFNKVLEQFTAFQVRSDQMAQRLGSATRNALPENDDRGRPTIWNTGRARPVVRAVLPTPSEVAAVSPRPIDPVRLPLPDQAESSAADGMAPESVALEQPACAYIAGCENFTERNGRARR